MSYHHLSTSPRGRIQTLHELGYSNRRIALLVGRHRSCIDRELKRNTLTATYQAEIAQQSYRKRRLKSRPKGKHSEELAEIIEEKLRETWSPEQIANTITKGLVSFKTIYTWLYKGKLSQGDMSVLRHKGKRRKPAEKRGKFIVGESISNRPKEVEDRKSFGHWELDTIVSSRGKSKGCLATFLERKRRLYTAIKMVDRTSNSMKKAITQIYRALPPASFKTGTTDRGKEFACYNAVKEDLDLTLYFADPYCSWQRGSNENSNGLLREFYPKKTDFALISEEELTQNLYLINNRPRKCLGWKSPIQVFLHEVAHLT